MLESSEEQSSLYQQDQPVKFPVNLLIAGIIVVFAWILNLSVICAMRSLNSGSRVIYGFLSSLCVANLFLATLNFPPSILARITVTPSVRHALCITWAYLDTLLCNTALLHILGSSLDCYLRLRHPHRHRPSTAPLPTCLKLSAPWTLAFLQATAFMAVAKLPPVNTPSQSSATISPICTLPDPNFLILRSIMCFGLPVLVSAILVFLSARGLHRITRHIPPIIEKSKHNIRRRQSQVTSSHNSSIGSITAVLNGEGPQVSMDLQLTSTTTTTTTVTTSNPITTTTYSSTTNQNNYPTTSIQTDPITREITLETIAGTISPMSTTSPPDTQPFTNDISSNPTTQDTNNTLPSASTFISPIDNNYVSLYQHSCPRHGILSFSLDKQPTTTLLPLIPIQQTDHSFTVHCPDVVPTLTPNTLQQSKSHSSISTHDQQQQQIYTTHNALTNSHSMDLQRLYIQLQQQQQLQQQHQQQQMFYRCNHRLSNPADYTTQSLNSLQHTTTNTITTKDIINNKKSKNKFKNKKTTLLTQQLEQHERVAVAINLTLCIFSIVLWGPYIVGSLIQGVCKPPYCILPISSNRMIEFKWLSYCLCIVYPILFVIIDSDIRDVIKRSISCR